MAIPASLRPPLAAYWYTWLVRAAKLLLFSAPCRSRPGQMAREGRFPLATALFDWPASNDCAAPDQYAPETWKASFDEHQAADRGVLCGLFRSCTSGRDYVLQRAPTITLTLDTTVSQEPTAWLSRISTLRQILSARGSRPVHLTVVCDDTEHSAAAASVIGALGDSVAVAELRVKDKTPYDEQPSAAASAIHHLTAPALGPHLTTLAPTCAVLLPPPSSLTNVTQILADLLNSESERWPDDVHDRVLDSIAPYLPQLTSLTVHIEGDLFMHRVLTDTSHTLTSFTASCALGPELVGLLLDHCPALENIHCQTLWLDPWYDDRTWGVKRVVIDESEYNVGVQALPLPHSGQIEIQMDNVDFDAIDDEVSSASHSAVRYRAVRHTYRGCMLLGNAQSTRHTPPRAYS